MKYEGQIENFRFIGDSSVNRVKKTVKGQPTETYTQTELIAALNEQKSLVCGGSKLITGKNDPRIGYIVYFGKTRTNPEQIIKIVIDKEMIEKGDINALAIDSVCQYALRVNKKNNKKLALGALAGTLGGLVVAGSLIGGMIWAAKKEGEMQNKKTENYQEWLHEERMENGTYKSWLEEKGLIDAESIDEFLTQEQTNGRSY